MGNLVSYFVESFRKWVIWFLILLKVFVNKCGFSLIFSVIKNYAETSIIIDKKVISKRVFTQPAQKKISKSL